MDIGLLVLGFEALSLRLDLTFFFFIACDLILVVCLHGIRRFLEADKTVLAIGNYAYDWVVGKAGAKTLVPTLAPASERFERRPQEFGRAGESWSVGGAHRSSSAKSNQDSRNPECTAIVFKHATQRRMVMGKLTEAELIGLARLLH